MAMKDTSTQVDSNSLYSNAAGKSVSTTKSDGPPPVSGSGDEAAAVNDEEKDADAAGDDAVRASSHSSPQAESLAERVSHNSSARREQHPDPQPDPQQDPSEEGTTPSNQSGDGSQSAETVDDNIKKWTFNLSSWAMRFLGHFAYHHLLMVLLLIVIVLSSVLVAGCSSQGLRNVYLLSLSYHKSPEAQSQSLTQLNPSFFADVANISSSANLEVRVGYFGLCATLEGQDWTCATDSNVLTETLNATHDPLNLIWVGDNFQNQVFLSALIIISTVLTLVEIALLASFPGWHEESDEDGSTREVKPFPSKSITRLCIGFSSLISLFLMIAILWQHVAAVAQSSTVQTIFDGSVKTQVGSAAMAFGWVSVGLNVLNTVMLWVMIASLDVLERLTGDN